MTIADFYSNLRHRDVVILLMVNYGWSMTVMVLICWLTNCWVDHLGDLKVRQG